MDEAVHFGHHDVVTILRDYHNQYTHQEGSTAKKNEENLDGLLWWRMHCSGVWGRALASAGEGKRSGGALDKKLESSQVDSSLK